MIKHYRSVILLFFILGCIPPPERIESPAVPTVISITSLPPLTEISQASRTEISAIFLIQNDGTVGDVRLLSTSGDPRWDSAATDSLRKWQFTAPSRDIDGEWVRYRIRIEIEDPLYLNIGEIITSNKDEADSLYQCIRTGTDFISLVRQIREETIPGTGIEPRLVNIAQYPEHVRKQLRNLRVNLYTRPIKVGDNYTIYMRFDEFRMTR